MQYKIASKLKLFESLCLKSLIIQTLAIISSYFCTIINYVIPPSVPNEVSVASLHLALIYFESCNIKNLLTTTAYV
ncbi:MAG: hypothetical protein K0Q51_1097 [Rickettsiaceae bacterium]|jgi:hypothetical protein|nr:hypothetical protein [Rickettsiaceae bacterium]